MNVAKGKAPTLAGVEASISKTTLTKAGIDVNDFNSPSPSLANATPAKTMSSLEIAELTGKRHNDVLRDIRNTLEDAGIDAAQFCAAQTYGNNNTREIFNLPRLECDLVISGYSVKYRLAIIKRWHDLESGAALPNPGNLHGIFQAKDAKNRATAIGQAADLFPRTLKSLGALGLSRTAQATRANELVQQACGIDYLGLAGNPHLAADFDPAPVPAQQKQLNKLLAYIAKGSSSGAKLKAPGIRYGQEIEHTNLLRAMHLKTDAFTILVEQAIAQGLIVRKTLPGFEGGVYALAGGHPQAMQVQVTGRLFDDQGGRMLSPTQQLDQQLDRLKAVLRKSTWYKDQTSNAGICQPGVMTHSMLMKTAGFPISLLTGLIQEAIQRGIIQKTSAQAYGSGYGGNVYSLIGAAA